jgi:hypothetical protein
VTQANPGARRIATQGIPEHRDLPRTLLHEQIAVIRDESDARGVVAAVLEATEPIQQDGPGRSGSGISNDAAHD